MSAHIVKRTQAVLKPDSPLHEHVHRYNPEALQDFSKKELKLARKLLGDPAGAARKEGVPHYCLHTTQLLKLLRGDDGVETWNKILKSYKKFADTCVIEMESIGYNENSVVFSGLDLDGVDFSDILLRDAWFVRCSFRGAILRRCTMGGAGHQVVFDCCNLERVDLDSLVPRPYYSSEYWLYRFDANEKLKPVTADSWERFNKEVGEFAVTHHATEIEREIAQTPKNPF